MNQFSDFFSRQNIRIAARGAAPSGVLSVAATVSALLLGASQARADDPPSLVCDSSYGGSCVVGSYGTDQPPASGSGATGATGGTSNPIAGRLPGPITLQQYEDGSTTKSAFDVRTWGGRGGDGTDGQGDALDPQNGGGGGNGGLAGDITVSTGPAVTAVSNGDQKLTALTIFSSGGYGGNGGKPTANAIAGESGTGGNGGNITVLSLDGLWTTQGGSNVGNILSVGGGGGVGANARQAGNGGAGGNGSDVTVTLDNSQNQAQQFNGTGGLLIGSIGGSGGTVERARVQMDRAPALAATVERPATSR